MALDRTDGAIGVGDCLALGDFTDEDLSVFANATTEGVVRAPSEFGMTTGSPPSRTETTELVVPRSMPTALAMGVVLLLWVSPNGLEVRS